MQQAPQTFRPPATSPPAARLGAILGSTVNQRLIVGSQGERKIPSSWHGAPGRDLPRLLEPYLQKAGLSIALISDEDFGIAVRSQQESISLGIRLVAQGTPPGTKLIQLQYGVFD